MTSSEKLDYLLATQDFPPRISQVVDVEQYKYVWGSNQKIRCGDWVIEIFYGMLSDGSSCVPDRVPSAWWAHDRLYLSPWGYYKGVRKRVSKRQADMIYAKLGLNRVNPWVFIEGLLLATGINRRVWKNYRKQDEAKLIEAHTVPRPLCWQFPTQYTRDAVWIGPDGCDLSTPADVRIS